MSHGTVKATQNHGKSIATSNTKYDFRFYFAPLNPFRVIKSNVFTFQFYSPIRDYSNIDSQAPKFKEAEK